MHMISPEAFSDLVADAYQHLYDLAALRTHALTRLLLPEAESSGKEKAWELHTLMMNTIEELNPGPQAPVNSPEWRRYRLLKLRFIEGAEPQAVADGLFISRRHFYRELPQALDACSQLLWNRLPSVETFNNTLPENALSISATPDNASALDQLRAEAAKFPHLRASADVKMIIEGVAALLNNLMTARGIQTEWLLDDCLPLVQMDGNILRQILLGLMNFFLGEAGTRRIDVVTAHSAAQVMVTMMVQNNEEQGWFNEEAHTLELVHELAGFNGASLSWAEEHAGRMHFLLKLPTVELQPVLVADDNVDIRRLVSSMLAGRYRVIEAANGLEVVRLAHELRPGVILLDLMMPESDGWEALQRLKNGQTTRSIPVIIFSVLGMRDLALSLGAAAFLEKPVSETALIETLCKLM